MALAFFRKYKTIWLYGASLAVLLFLLKWLELRFIIYDHAFEAYIGAIALLFTSLGIWLAMRLTKPKVETVVIEKEIYRDAATNFIFNEKAFAGSGMSKRELEVLQLMTEGHSNQQIADQLYVSLNTIKTHNSRIFEKLDVKSRTQAIEKAKRLGLIP